MGERDAIGREFHRRWSALKPPLRPPPAVVAAMGALVRERGGTGLQLGVTPEIARLLPTGIAVDWNAEMIRLAWPGDDATHRAIVADWLALPLGDASIDVVFGDASLTMLSWPDGYVLLFREVARVLRPGGRLVLRCFVAPVGGEAVEAIFADALAGRIDGFAAFKLRLNMAVFQRAGATSREVDRIHRAFERHCPDRGAFARATGWSGEEIDSIDAYRGGRETLTYPTRRQIAAIVPAGARYRFVATHGYPLAERCPLLVIDFA